MNVIEKIQDLEKRVFELTETVEKSLNYSQGLQTSLWDSDEKQAEKNKDLANSTNNVSNNLINYEVKNDTKLNNTISDTWTPRVWSAGEFCSYNDKFWRCEVNNSNPPGNTPEWKALSIAEVMLELINKVSKLESEV